MSMVITQARDAVLAIQVNSLGKGIGCLPGEAPAPLPGRLLDAHGHARCPFRTAPRGNLLGTKPEETETKVCVATACE